MDKASKERHAKWAKVAERVFTKPGRCKACRKRLVRSDCWPGARLRSKRGWSRYYCVTKGCGLAIHGKAKPTKRT